MAIYCLEIVVFFLYERDGEMCVMCLYREKDILYISLIKILHCPLNVFSLKKMKFIFH